MFDAMTPPQQPGRQERVQAAAQAQALPQVRQATRADLPSLQRLWRHMMDEHVERHAAFTLADDAGARWHAVTCDMLSRADSFVLLASLGEQIAGFCSGWTGLNPPIYQARHVGLISELAVARQARRRGVGTALVHHARAWFRRRGLSEFQLSTAVDNTAGRAFWRAVGGAELLVRYHFTL